jgi:hypothetical protein
MNAAIARKPALAAAILHVVAAKWLARNGFREAFPQGIRKAYPDLL